jgi:hypothetical protein
MIRFWGAATGLSDGVAVCAAAFGWVGLTPATTAVAGLVAALLRLFMVELTLLALLVSQRINAPMAMINERNFGSLGASCFGFFM